MIQLTYQATGYLVGIGVPVLLGIGYALGAWLT